MKWFLRAGFISFVISSSGLALATLLTLYWRRCRNSKAIVPSPVPRPVLDISDYKVSVIDTAEQCEAYFKRLQDTTTFIGFDCEWVSDNQRNNESSYYPVALLQLAFPNKECALVRLSKIGRLTESLQKILTDKSSFKFGVGIMNDVTRLCEWSGTLTVSCIDLRNVAFRCGIRRNNGLGGLLEQLTDSVLTKSKEITCSNWERDVLSDDQILYAARDAIAGLIILSKLAEHKKRRTKSDSCQTMKSDTISEEEKSCVFSLCQGIIDVNYNIRNNSQPQKPQASGRTAAYSIRQSPLYYNCQLIAPDGTLLSTVDKRKVEWYLSKELGVLVSEDPPVLQLLFEPSGKPKKDREYYLTEKENICVVCGRKDSYIRKNVVPHEYRKFFPPKMKEHLSHDVLLLCVTCHQLSTHHDSIIKQQIALEYSAPLEASTQKFHEDPEKVKLRSLARALKGHKETLPKKRREDITETLAKHFNCEKDEVTDDMIEELLKIETRLHNPNYVSHGELVVKAVKEREDLVEFQQRWRQHFLDSMQPQYLPKLWSVYHNPQ
ncbi:PREDICTED: exonuclease 3'-5' domain-containing protein 2-like isoform X2 [Amphimedon queenslandica]|uniref:3'-5' exonuclease domain-containing protein n=1 Tax=Amphimedon queenslandica TaxID=400682 RepID=A0AAN0IGA2_AMPQE|nr:PREDICTED: exonuclease 3'-5' domain-containing protein 2-like isoform X2 [Amphimedon queenslandica]|eukprot:XP_003388132.1 PREDICTED: exonuclease 3'-5' domain-containing protein 2-like isoform X2 [Amphimedon queenslandica]